MLFSFLISLMQFNIFLPEPQQKKSPSKLDDLLFISDIPLLIELYQPHFKSTYLFITVITNNQSE